jgi:nudix-type nucleoside diphosphatase (YffH/AdpP family)
MIARIMIDSIETLSHRFVDLRLYALRYTRYDGQVTTLKREVHDHGHGACVLPYDSTRGTVLLVRQFRLPVFLSGESGDVIEACAGLLDGNAPETCVRREAEEELGYRVDNLRQVASTFMTPGAVTERITMFLADYRPDWKVNDGGGHAAEGEDIEVLEMPFAEAWTMLQQGRILDAKTVMSLMFLERELNTRL